MVYCLNPACTQPLNGTEIDVCQFCGQPLSLGEHYQVQQLCSQNSLTRTLLASDTDPAATQRYIVRQILHVNPGWQTLVQKLQGLPKDLAIAHLTEAIYIDPLLYIIESEVPGESLAHVVEHEGPLTEVQIWQLLRDLLPTLQILHDQQMLFGDMKPENLIRTIEENQIALVNLASIQMLGFSPVRFSLEGIADPEYSPPEQIQGYPVAASDLYSLGLTCLHLLTGHTPWDLVSALAQDAVPWPNATSNALQQILRQLTMPQVKARFPTVSAVWQALQAAGVVIPFSQRPNLLPTTQHQWTCTHIWREAQSEIQALTLNSQQTQLGAVTADGQWYCWEKKTGQLLSSQVIHRGTVNTISISSPGNLMATAGTDKIVKLWRWGVSGQLEAITHFTGHEQQVTAMAWHPTQPLLASASWDKTIHVREISANESNTTPQILRGQKLAITSLAFSPEGRWLASGSFDRTVCLWNVQANSPQIAHTLAHHTSAVLAVAFSPDGQWLASGGNDCTITLWQLQPTLTLIAALSAHSWPVLCLQFGADSRWLWSASADHTIKGWKIPEATLAAILKGHEGDVTTLAPDNIGQILWSGSRDRTMRQWKFRN
jgi:serine/threonine protein kinase